MTNGFSASLSLAPVRRGHCQDSIDSVWLWKVTKTFSTSFLLSLATALINTYMTSWKAGDNCTVFRFLTFDAVLFAPRCGCVCSCLVLSLTGKPIFTLIPPLQKNQQRTVPTLHGYCKACSMITNTMRDQRPTGRCAPPEKSERKPNPTWILHTASLQQASIENSRPRHWVMDTNFNNSKFLTFQCLVDQTAAQSFFFDTA